MTAQHCTESMLGYEVTCIGRDETVGQIVHWIKHGRQPKWLACINPHSYVVARSDAAFAGALRAAHWLIPDGIGIIMASRLLGGSLTERVTGSDIFEGVHRRLDATGGSVFLLGASEETLRRMRDRICLEHPGVRVVGMFSPDFKAVFSSKEIQSMVSAINAAAPDVLWVGMSSPKQDLWIHSNLHRLNVRFAAGVGAVFDFYAGRVRRSPILFRKAGLEWLPRLIQEPRRLWRRMFISAPIFIWDAACAKFRR